MSDVKTVNGPVVDGLALFRRQWNDTCKAAGIVSISKCTAAKLLAIVYVLGGERESFTHNEKLKADLDYIQDVYGFQGGCFPDEMTTQFLKHRVRELEKWQEVGKYPEWATKLMEENYEIKL